MNISYFIDHLETKGFVFFLENEKIKFYSPTDSLTLEINMELKSAKDELYILLKKRQENKFLPLSYGQRALLFEYQFAPKSPAYNIVLSAKIDNHIDIKIFEATFKSLVKKHPMLRTTYGFSDGVPYQDIHDDIEFQLKMDEVFNWSREKVEQWSLKEADKPFNLYDGPLFKVCILTNSIENQELERYFFFCVHHIALDLWSLNIVLQDITALYRQNSQNIIIKYDSKIEYINYINWQRKGLIENESKLKKFWDSKLSGQIEFSGFPTSKRYPATRSFQGEFYSSKLNPDLLRKINELAKIKGVTPYVVALSALFILIAKLSGNNKVVILTPAAGRNCPNSELTVGYYVNPIPLIVELDSNPSFSDFLIDIRTLVLDSLEHQDFPISRIIELIKTKNGLNHFSLFQTLFLWDQEQVDESFNVNIDGVSLFKEKLITEQRGAAFDLQIAAISINKTLHISWRYATDLYDRETIISFSKKFEKLIEKLLLNVSAPVLSHSLLDPMESEYQQLIHQWNQTDKVYFQDQTITQLFEKQVKHAPDAIALVFEGERLSYFEVNQRANQLARFIRKKYQEQTLAELKPDTLIALCIHRRVEMIIAILGILKAGGAYVPIDPTCPAERIQYIVDDTKAALLLTEQALVKNFQNHTHFLQIINLDEQKHLDELGDNLLPQSNSYNLAYIIYTSGTTGKPKGVMIEQKSVVNVLTEMFGVYRLDKEDKKVAAYSAYSFDVSVTEFFATLLQGGILHLLSEKTRTDIELLSQYIKNHQINYIFLPPAILSILPDKNYLKLKGVIFAGERCDQKVGEYWASRYQLFNYYGPTEITVYATGGCVSPENVNVIGKLIMNTRIYVCDRNLQPVPIGVAGELYIGGAGLARGYLNQSELTQERFIENPFATKEDVAKGYTRLYKTGDLVRWLPDGNLEYLGRNDFQIKLRGYRIELNEIENVLSSHPEIKQSVVLLHPQEGQPYLIAYYVATSALSQTQLMHFLSQSLPDYMIPSCFMPLESFPLTTNGKLDRKALPAPKLIAETIYVAPRNELEKQLCEIWQELLKVEKIGIYDDFFRMGGNSIFAIQAVHRIGQQINREVSIAELFQHKTIAKLGELLNLKMAQVTQKYTETQVDRFIDLKQELGDTTITLNAEEKGNFIFPKGILLTGSTGYVGAFLLQDLLENTDSTIYCLVRANSLSEATSKLYNNLNKYQITVEDKSRIIPILGDLEKNNLGFETKDYDKLCTLIDVIYHNGAYVHHLLPYEALKQSNVKGTFEIIKFANLNKLKFIHFISTISVLPRSGNQIFNEESPIEKILHMESSGYSASKWVAENMIMRAAAAGVPANIYRIGRAAACSKTGVCNVDDFFYRLIVSCIKMGYYPDIPFNFDATPIDMISKQIVKIAKSDPLTNKVFHIISPKPTSLASILQCYNEHEENIKSTPLPLWCQIVKDSIGEGNPLPISPYLSQFAQYADVKLSSSSKFNEFDHISHSKTMCYLKNIDEDYSLDMEQYYWKNFKYMEATGVFNERKVILCSF